MTSTAVHRLELELDVFLGPFDLLLSLILREELDLREVELAEIVLSYVDYLEQQGELDLEATTEFLVLIAALLELKSRLMLPNEQVDDLEEFEPSEAADELFERLVQYARFRGAGKWMGVEHEEGQAALFRSAPLPPSLRRVAVDNADVSYDPDVLGKALGNLLKLPPKHDLSHMAAVRVSLSERLGHLRKLLRGGRFLFDEAVENADRMTVAVTLFALLELYKRGEADWEQEEPFAPISVLAQAPPTFSHQEPERLAA